ncbi:hypothetical protein DMA11_14715 [Marinilabiliaceae bacterium JC017]|nr:hypothetical protein DMA11_14715 [Marinilabiliaceae bacterium JC017]
MTKKEIETFIAINKEDDIKSFFDKLLTKLDASNRSNDKILIWMAFLIFIYFSIDLDIFSQLKLGPIVLTDNSFIKLFTPLIFNYLLLKFVTLNAHRSLIINNIRQIGGRFYNLKEGVDENATYSNAFLQIIMPFSLWEEVNSKYMNKGKTGCLTFLMISPLFILLFAPLIFEYIIIRDLIVDFWQISWVQKTVTITTIWIFLAVIIYYIKAVKIKMTENQTD